MTDESPKSSEPTNIRVLRRKVVWGLLGLILILAVGLTAGGVYLRDRTVPAGARLTEWVKIRADAAIGADVLRFEDLRLGLTGAGHPQVVLRNVGLDLPDQGEILRLGEMRATLSRAALWNRQLSLTNVAATGAQIQVRRDADGRFELALGEADTALEDAQSFAQLLQQIETSFDHPNLQALTGATLRNATILYSDGQSNQTWTGDGGRVTLNREDGLFSLSGDMAVLTGGDDLARVTLSYDHNGITDVTTLSATIEDAAARDIASQSPALAWLAVIDAPITGFLRADLDENGLGPLNAALEIGAGALQPIDATRAIPFSGAKSYFTYVPKADRLEFSQVTIDSAWGRLSGSGTAFLQSYEGHLPTQIIGQFQMPDLEINPAALFDAPVALQDTSVDFRLALDPFTLTVGESVVFDGPSKARLSGVVAADPKGWRVAMDALVDETSPQRLLALWPPSLAVPLREWIATNIPQAVFRQMAISLRAQNTEPPEFFVTHEFSDAEITFVPSLPPIKGGAGVVSLVNDRLSAHLYRGQVTAPRGGRVDVAGSSLILQDTRQKPVQAEVRLKTDSTITAALAILNEPPFRLLDKADRPVTLADGRARASGLLRFPLKAKIPKEDLAYDIAADLTQLRSEVIVPGRVIAAGSLALRATPKELVIEGPVRFDQLPVIARWTLPFAPGTAAQVVGTGALSNASLDVFNVTLPQGALRGEAQAEFAVTLPKGGTPGFRLQSKLRGLALDIPEIGWAKGAGTAGDLTLSGQLGAAPSVDALSLEAPGLTAQGRLRLASGAFEALELSQLRVGNWLRGAAVIRSLGAGRPPSIALRDGQLDLRQAAFSPGGGGASGGGGSSGGPSAPLELDLDVLRISDQIALTGFRGAFESGGGLDGGFVGRVNGGAQVNGTISPGPEGPIIRITGADAGAAIRDAGLNETISGGALNLTLRSRAAPGTFDGTLAITSVRVRDAPEMAALLSAISVVGLVEQLDGKGLVFQNVDAKFRLTPEQLIVTQSSAVGPSLGLSLDGLYQLRSKALDMQGVISPLYLVNGIGAIFTRRGEGLIGFNFTLRGTSEVPRVGVNPLSVLTPGMFREIFRRPAPKVSP